MIYLLSIFKTVSVIFAISAVTINVQVIVDSIDFSRVFELTLSSTLTNSVKSFIDNEDAVTFKTTAILHYHHSLTMSYISLMKVRQLATRIILLIFAYQNKWTEMTIILVIIDIVVADTDEIYLSRVDARQLEWFHAILDALIAALACEVICFNAWSETSCNRLNLKCWLDYEISKLWLTLSKESEMQKEVEVRNSKTWTLTSVE